MPSRKKKKPTDTPSVFPEHDVLELIRKSVGDITSNQSKIIKLLETQGQASSTIAKQLSALLKLAEALYEYQLEEEEEIDEEPQPQPQPVPIAVEVEKLPAKHSLAKTFDRLRSSKVI
tara:strand:+ start:4864 stop:5217 length:354 start_codon:yes stop_codon:yes gene_type:complete